MKRIIFIGDVHSTFLELKELIKKVEYNSNTDRVILLGDLTDRGLFPTETIRYVRDMKFDCILGNHDAKILKWHRNKNPDKNYPDYYNKLSEDDISFIANMPTYIEFDDVIAIHAGMRPGIPLSRQGSDLMYLRYTDSNRKLISLRKISELGIKATGARFWTEFGPFGKSIIYGHQVHSMTDVRIDKFDDGTAAYGIDLGCCFGGHLACIIKYNDNSKPIEIVKVKAKQIYYQSNFVIKD